MMKIYEIEEDAVIRANYMIGSTNYRYALEHIHPLINKLDIQRKLQNAKFYRRLEDDLIKGCIMPPITIAFVINGSINFNGRAEAQDYVANNIGHAFVLDGIQRLNTLKRASDNHNSLDLNRPMYLNIILCKSMDNLLYRMITLNNGQKPMTIRHQIEMLAGSMYDFEHLDVKVKSEKAGKKGLTYAFKKDDLIKSYTAFLSSSVNFDNQKIIEDKLNEILAENIIESNVTESSIEFVDVTNFIKMSSDLFPDLLDWFRVSNNLVGFAAGISKFNHIPEDVKEFHELINNFEEAMKTGFDVSKLKLGQTRRRLVFEIISRYHKYKNMGANELIDDLSIAI